MHVFFKKNILTLFIKRFLKFASTKEVANKIFGYSKDNV